MTTDDLLARADPHRLGWYPSTDLKALVAELAAEVRALTARLDAAHWVIRDVERAKPGLLADFTGWEPEQAAEIRAATADPTPQTDTDDG